MQPTGARVVTAQSDGVTVRSTSDGETTLTTPWPHEKPVIPFVTATCGGVLFSPWVDAKPDKEGNWQLPQYNCEEIGLEKDDPKNVMWKPGDYLPGVDNAFKDPETEQIMEYGGEKMWEGEEPPEDYDPSQFPQNVQKLLTVPYLPSQPLKNSYARLKAIQPESFEDRNYDAIYRDMPRAWKRMSKKVVWAESFGCNQESSPGEWQGQEFDLVPAVYHTPRADALTICVGNAVKEGEKPRLSSPSIEGTEYDYLEYLYAKDQLGRIIQIRPGDDPGMYKTTFMTYSFAPPTGTSEVTPFAFFAIRGVWEGTTVKWDTTVENKHMKWFSEAAPQKPEAKAAPKKIQPVLWPENSWEGNCARAREWNQH